MRNLIIKEKTGFRTSLPFEIIDSKGRLFYSNKFCNALQNKGFVKFNLPKGTYKYNGTFEKLPRVVEQVNINLPKPERLLNESNYRIEYGENPNKCTIYYSKGLILFDNQFKNLPKFIKIYIFLHEIGHHYYKTEKLADLFATKKMLELGFNPSQVGLTQLFILSDKQKERKEFIINNLTQKNNEYER